MAAIESSVVLIDAPSPCSINGVISRAVEAHSLRTVASPLDPVEVKAKSVRFNDGACDARGRFWVGSMTRPELRDGRERGELWRVDPDGKSTKFLDGVGTSNGIDWSPDNKLMCECWNGP